MARPKSEDKKQALLEAATAAFAQSGIAASTSAIARSAGVAEGTLFRYFATKDELLNELYLAIKLRLVRTMIAGLDPDEKRPKENARNIWNSYIDWGVRNPMEHKAIRRMALSERITDETRRQVKESFPEQVASAAVNDHYRDLISPPGAFHRAPLVPLVIAGWRLRLTRPTARATCR